MLGEKWVLPCPDSPDFNPSLDLYSLTVLELMGLPASLPVMFALVMAAVAKTD